MRKEKKKAFSEVLQTFGPHCITLFLSFREKATESKDGGECFGRKPKTKSITVLEESRTGNYVTCFDVRGALK